MGLPAEMLIDLGEALRSVEHDGPASSVTSEQLNVNLVRLVEGACIPQHKNDEVDVLMVVLQGTCKLYVDDEMTVLRPGTAAVIPRGLLRAVRCTMGPLAYLTCHRRRAPLMPTMPGTIHLKEIDQPPVA